MPDRRAEPPTGRIFADPDGRLLYRGTAAGRGQRRFLRMVPLRLRLPGRNRNASPPHRASTPIRHAAATKSASPTYSRRKTSNGRWSYWAKRSKHITTGNSPTGNLGHAVRHYLCRTFSWKPVRPAPPGVSANPIPYRSIFRNFRPKSLGGRDSFHTFALDFYTP